MTKIPHTKCHRSYKKDLSPFYLWRNYIHQAFPGGSDGKASAYNVGDRESIPGSGRSPGEGNGNPLQYSCLEKSHGWRSLVGYCPWTRKESDMTARINTALSK